MQTNQNATLRSNLLKILIEFFDLKTTSTEEMITIDNISNWDSAKHVELVVSLEEKLNIEFEPEDIPLLTSFQSIFNICNK